MSSYSCTHSGTFDYITRSPRQVSSTTCSRDTTPLKYQEQNIGNYFMFRKSSIPDSSHLDFMGQGFVATRYVDSAKTGV